jgi:hypothetical protein
MVAAIGTAENIKNLEQIRKHNLGLVDGSVQDINSPFGSYTNPPFSLSLSLSISPAIPPAYMKYPQCRVHLYALP